MEFECSVRNKEWTVEIDVISLKDYQYELLVFGNGRKFHILIGIHK